MIEVNPSLSFLDNLDRQFARHLAEIELQVTESEPSLLLERFQIPSCNALLTIEKPLDIFEHRDSDVGMNYFEALKNWQSNPYDNETKEKLSIELRKYTKELWNLYIEKGRNIKNPGRYLDAIIPGGESDFGNFCRKYLKAFISNLIPFNNDFTSLIAGDITTCLFNIGSQKNSILRLGEQVRLEVEKEMTLISKEEKEEKLLKSDAVFE